MNKTFKVIPVEDYGVVVDEKGTTPVYNGWVYDSDIRRLTTIVTNSWEEQNPHQFPLIGIIGKRLEGVTLIELADDDIYIYELANKAMNGGNNLPKGLVEYRSRAVDFAFDKYIEGYKTNTNKYSEEEMRNAMVDAFNKTGSRKEFEKYIDNYIERLQKQPIPTEIELEIVEIMEHGKRDAIGVATFNTSSSRYKLVIHNKETNTITAVNYKT